MSETFISGPQAAVPASISATQLSLVVAEDIPAATNPSEKTTPGCEHCGKDFVPRAGSGGKPQGFCSTDCRRQFHGGNSPTPPTLAPTSDVGDTPPPAQEKATTDVSNWRPSTGVEYEKDDYKWDYEDVVLEEQTRTAIYWNVHGNLVIRQVGRDFEDDPYVVICQNNLRKFIERICDMAHLKTDIPNSLK